MMTYPDSGFEFSPLDADPDVIKGARLAFETWADATPEANAIPNIEEVRSVILFTLAF